MSQTKKPAEGSAAEEKTETPAFEKKEDANKKPMFGKKRGKPISPDQAKRMASMLKAKTVVKPVTAPVDDEDKLDGGIDEDKE